MTNNVMWEPSADDFNTLVRTVGSRLKKTMPTIPPQRIDEKIEEIVQSGFLQYLEVIQDENAEEIRKPAHWVANAALNKGMNAMRDSGVRRKRENPTDGEGMDYAAHASGGIEGRASGAINPIDKVMSAEAMATLFAAIRSLTDRQLEVFVKVDIDHERQTDVAKQLNTRVGSIEKVLDAARARVWWIVAKSNYEGLCDDFYNLIPGLDTSDKPSKKQTQIIAKHVRTCDECRASICEGPLAIDIGAVAGAGIIGGGGSATFAERLADSPIIAKPLSVAESISDYFKGAVDKLTPGSSHASEAAVGTASGAGVAGVGGAAVLGGSKIVLLCAGTAVTACVAGVATGVVPIPEAKSEKQRNQEIVEKQLETQQVAHSETAVPTVARPSVDPRVAGRKVAVKQRVEQARRERAVAQRKAERKAEAQQAKKEAAAVAQAAETEQYSTNQSTADQSFSIPGTSAPSYTPPPPTSSSSGSSAGTTAPTPQQQTNDAAASDSFGL